MLFENSSFDVNIPLFVQDVDFMNENTESTNKVLTPMEGFLRGNMFKDEYVPYKNLTYFKLNPTSEKEKMLFNIMALAFAITDLNLYLDLNPDDNEMYNLFKKYVNDKDKLCKEYEIIYGPLEITGDLGNKYNWLDSPWPWDKKGGSMYV